MKYRHVHATSGLTLVYHWNDKFGWSFEASGHPKGRIREAVILSQEFWPATPADKVNEIVENNMELINICRAVVVNYE